MMRRCAQGFTLIEMVVAITISALVAALATMFIGVPVQSYIAQRRRADFADSAQLATRWVTQDVNGAVPNSLRVATVSGRPAVEMIASEGVAIYRHAGGEGDILNFAANDSRFDVLGAPGVTATYVIVNHLGVGGADAYALADVIARATINPNSARITLSPAFRFAAASPNRRAFLASSATRYECDLSAGTLRRYTNLPLTATMGPLGSASTVIATDVSACRFVIAPSTARHGGMLMMELTLSRAVSGSTESVRVLSQSKVENVT